MFIDKHKEQRMLSGRAFLDSYRQDGDDLFSQTIKADETWLSYDTPETKRQLMQWRIQLHENRKKIQAISLHDSKNDDYCFLT